MSEQYVPPEQCECTRCGAPIYGSFATFRFCEDCNSEIDDD